MRNQREHLSDEELLLAADREFGPEAARTRSHLECCPRCRSRTIEIERILGQLAQGQRERFDPELPPIGAPRAALRARLSRVSAGTRSPSSCLWMPERILTGPFWGGAMAAVLALSVGLLYWNSPGRDRALPVPILAERTVLPNHAFTPGSVHTVSLNQVCSLPHEEVIKQVAPSQRRIVFEEYGIPLDQSDRYEVDYLVTPGLGGNDDIRNLWPQPYHARTWNAGLKDALEERLHQMVCAQQLDLPAAQEAIATDWIAAYQKYVRTYPVRPGTWLRSLLSKVM